MDMNIVEQLRRAVADAGVTPYRVAKDSGLPVSVIQAWWRGGGLRCDSAERIAKALSCRIVLERFDETQRRENRADKARARKALRERGSIPWKRVKADLGL